MFEASGTNRAGLQTEFIDSTLTGQIIAYGGCGTGDPWFDPRLTRYVVRSCGRPNARVGLVTAATADPDRRVSARLMRAYRQAGANPTHLDILGNGLVVDRMADSFDIIHLEGGNLELLMERLRRTGMTDTLRQAWRDGVLLTGTSAGAACCFDQAVGASLFAQIDGEVRFELQRGLGLLPGALCVHADREPARRRAFRSALLDGPTFDSSRHMMGSTVLADAHGWELDHAAGLHFRGQDLLHVLASARGAGATKVMLRDGRCAEQRHRGASLGPLRAREQFGRRLESVRRGCLRVIHRVGANAR